MENFKGTKTPWKVCVREGRGSNYFSIESDNIRICNINSKRTELFKEEEANAQLIAHAPEMLEMLKELHQLLEENQGEAKFYTQGHHKRITDLLTRATTI